MASLKVVLNNHLSQTQVVDEHGIVSEMSLIQELSDNLRALDTAATFLLVLFDVGFENDLLITDCN